MKLKLFTEMFSDNAGVGAENIINVTSGHGFTPCQLLAREGIQNSVDASASKLVRVEINLKSLTGKERDKFLRETNLNSVLDEIPDQARGFKEYPDPIEVLTFSDYGTIGLAGVEKSSSIKEPSIDRFVGLCRNIADSDSQATGGGTYGFGKSIYWGMSELKTVFFYSRFKDIKKRANCKERFIGASNFTPFNKEKKRATGRAWFGDVKGRDYCAPLVDGEANKKITSMGFKPRNSSKENGTTIIIPAVKDFNSREKMEELADEILLFWWPAIQSKQLAVTLSYNNEPIEIPDPDSHPVTKFFAPLYQTILSQRKKEPEILDLREIANYDLTSRTICHEILESTSESFGTLSAKILEAHEVEALGELASTTAMIRSPGMVVEYLDFKLNESESYAGVFRSSDEMNPILARSEPAVHNKWDYKSAKLKDTTESNKVRNLNTKCKNHIREWLETIAVREEEDSQVSTLFGNLFGDLMRSPGSSQPPKSPSPIRINYSYFDQDKKSRLNAIIKVKIPEKESRIHIDQKWGRVKQIRFEVEASERIDQNASRRGDKVKIEKVDLTSEVGEEIDTFGDLKDWPLILSVSDQEAEYAFQIRTCPKSFPEQTIALTLKAELGLMNENGEFSPV